VAETPPAQAPSDAGALPKPDSIYVGGTTVKLTAADAMKYDTLRAEIEKALAGTPDEGLRFELYNLEDNRRSGGSSKEWELRIARPREEDQRAGQPQRIQESLEKLSARLSAEPYFPSITSFGGKVASSTQEQALLALAASLVLIVAYIWLRFQHVIFGLSAVVALVHDVLVTLGALALSSLLAPYLGFLLVDPFKIDLPIVAAFLTLIGFSLNDTIVIFDRIREMRGKSPDLSAELINSAINQTLSRTILTSLTVFITVLILYVWGGQGIHGFAFALLVGVIAGTYSTVFIATPTLLWLHNWQKSRAQQAAAAGNVRQAASAAR
jgi:SecD/SecF fusion protein